MMPTSGLITALYRTMRPARETAPRRRACAGARGAVSLGGAHPPRPLRSIDIRAPARQLRQGRRAFGDQPLAPDADAFEALGLARGLGVVRGERRADRLHVHRAHQLADILALARCGGAAGDA